MNRWVDDAYVIPKATEPSYIPILNRVIQKKNVEGIFPQPDPEVKTIAEAQNRLQAMTFLPSSDAVSKCLDKYAALASWHETGLRDEPTLVSFQSGELKRQLVKLRFPCWARAREGAGGLLSCMASNPTVLEHWIQFHWAQGIMSDFVVEEYLPGRDYCFMSIWDNGRIVTSMVRERLSWLGQRTIGTGGTSKLNRVVHSQRANDIATKAIQAITSKPRGILCVDLKEDGRGQPKPTEINCRFTTNVHYLTLAAVKYGEPKWNFPWLAAQLMIGERIPNCKEYDALPEKLWFTKNVDMGYTIVEDDGWRALVLKGSAS